MDEEKYTLREAAKMLEAITNEVASLLGVAASDIGDWELVDKFHISPNGKESAAVKNTALAHDFAEMLVMRIVIDGPLGFTWTDEEFTI